MFRSASFVKSMSRNILQSRTLQNPVPQNSLLPLPNLKCDKLMCKDYIEKGICCKEIKLLPGMV